MQQQDQFVLNYMNWLGHFEFGLNQKPFFLGDEQILDTMQRYPITEINYWLLTWKNYYQNVLGHVCGNVILVNFENFCAAPDMQLSALFSKIGVQDQCNQLKLFRPALKSAENIDHSILEGCNAIYQELAGQSKNQLA